MNPLRRELLNGVFVLVVASLMSAAFAAFQVSINVQLWVLILMAIAIAVGGYVVFEFVLSSERRETDFLKRIGTPARLEMNLEGTPAGANATFEALSALRPGVDLTVFTYFDSQGGGALEVNQEAYAIRDKTVGAFLERTKAGTLREYKRIICFDDEALANALS